LKNNIFSKGSFNCIDVVNHCNIIIQSNIIFEYLSSNNKIKICRFISISNKFLEVRNSICIFRHLVVSIHNYIDSNAAFQYLLWSKKFNHVLKVHSQHLCANNLLGNKFLGRANNIDIYYDVTSIDLTDPI